MKEKIELINDPVYFDHYKEWLEKIINSKTYKLWQKFCRIRSAIYHMNTKSLYKEMISIVPISTRQNIKGVLKSLSDPFPYKMPQNLLNELNNYSQNRLPESFDILNFSVIAWDYRLQRPQHLLSNLDKKHRTFYIKNEFLVSPSVKKTKPFRIEKKETNIYEITLSASKNLFIYSSEPSDKDKQIILASIKNLIKQVKIINPIAKIDHPFWANILEELSMPIIYDCMDNHQGFSDNSSNIVTQEKKLFNKSDLVITTSKYLTNLAQQNHAKNIELIPNAGDYQLFKTATTNLPAPKDIKKITHPIIGYYGAISDWFDTQILESLAKSGESVVLIGRVSNQQVINLAKQYKNIHLLGEKPYQLLPQYLKQFDVCTIPFVLNNLIKATHPVKIFEYFAAGKPVVATKMPEIENLDKLVYFSDKKSFLKNCQEALKEPSSLKKLRQTYAKNNTWKDRSQSLQKAINKILFPKVSIILLSYNSPQMLKTSLDSIINRSVYPNYELIVVDNNSDQETLKILNRYKNKPQVKIILNKQNYGFAKGNNIGLKHAKGDYIILLNNDIKVTPGWISRLIFHVRKDKVALVGPVTNSIGNEAKVEVKYNPENTIELEDKASSYTSLHWGEVLKVNNIAAFCWIMTKKTYQKIGELDERFNRGMFEDDDYCKRINKTGQNILIADDVFVHHYGGVSFKNIENKEYRDLFKENKLKFEKKWNTKWIPHQYRK